MPSPINPPLESVLSMYFVQTRQVVSRQRSVLSDFINLSLTRSPQKNCSRAGRDCLFSWRPDRLTATARSGQCGLHLQVKSQALMTHEKAQVLIRCFFSLAAPIKISVQCSSKLCRTVRRHREPRDEDKRPNEDSRTT